MPQEEYGGWLGQRVVQDFEEYAARCFELSGDRVKRWLTLNDPWCTAVISYATGEYAPGRKDAPATEPYAARGTGEAAAPRLVLKIVSKP